MANGGEVGFWESVKQTLGAGCGCVLFGLAGTAAIVGLLMWAESRKLKSESGQKEQAATTPPKPREAEPAAPTPKPRAAEPAAPKPPPRGPKDRRPVKDRLHLRDGRVLEGEVTTRGAGFLVFSWEDPKLNTSQTATFLDRQVLLVEDIRPHHRVHLRDGRVIEGVAVKYGASVVIRQRSPDGTERSERVSSQDVQKIEDLRSAPGAKQETPEATPSKPEAKRLASHRLVVRDGRVLEGEVVVDQPGYIVFRWHDPSTGRQRAQQFSRDDILSVEKRMGSK